MLDVVDPSVVAIVIKFMEEQVPFNRFLGMKAVEFGEGEAVLKIPFRDELIGDPFRPALHGGVISTLLDTTGGAAVFSTLSDIKDRTSTVDLRVDYLRPGRMEDLYARAHIVRVGNRVAVVDLKAFHSGAEDAPVATGTGVYNIRRAKDA